MITKSKSLATGSSGLPITFIRKLSDPTIGGTAWLMTESGLPPANHFPPFPEMTLNALLTHSRYLREEWLMTGFGLESLRRQNEILQQVQEMTHSLTTSTRPT